MDDLLRDMTSLPLPFTLATASLMGLFYIYLSWRVIRGRHKYKVDIGSGGQAPLERDVRTHGNFAEYTPLGILLLGLVEISGGHVALLWLLSLSLITGRILHFIGFANTPGISFGRVAGVTLTFGMIAVASIAGLIMLVKEL